ncbi:MAG: hypothetical protein A2Z16_16240 [Chloroflexi bacterium RBG_16_54_18]|nr:MAG: hypothetical protein A2Z16_16240 [Chloroflexi bacterium RBG_16_54_18]
MKKGQPDRVPVMCQLSWGHVLLNSGIRPFEFVFNPQAFAEGFWILRKRYNFDGILLDLGYHQPEETRSKIRVEIVEGGDMCFLPDGSRMFCPNNDDPRQYFDNKPQYPEIKNINVEIVNIDDFVPEWKLEPYKIMLARAAGDFSVHGEVFSPFDGLTEIMGIENAMVGLLTDPAKCHELLSRFVVRSFIIARAQISTGVDAMKISSPFAGKGFISKDFYRKFVLPHEKELVRKIHEFKPDIPVYMHTCGAIGDRLELMAESGVDGIECLDPPPLGDCMLADAKKRVGDRMFIKGNMDSVNVLLSTTPESMDEYVKQQITDGAGGGGYILSSACSVAPAVKPELLEALVPLAEKYGKYQG